MQITLNSRHDGFALPALGKSASGKPPNAKPLGGVVVIQEIFGVTPHIDEMAGAFAAAGYETLAPDLFARIEPGFKAGLDEAGFNKGRAAVAATSWDQVVCDIQAAIDALPKPCFVTGFCWGGAAAWAAAQRCTHVRAASCLYGRLITQLLDAPPKAPVMLHYGARDASIPPEDIERVRLAVPNMPLYLYEAGHGFCRRASADYDAASCDLAIARTLDWFARWRAAGEEA
jgi:carboxymethylenebutenolidase